MNRFKGWKNPEFDDDGWAYKGKYIEKIKHQFGEDEVIFRYTEPFGWRCQHPRGLKLGKKVDVGCFTYMNAKYSIEIGNNVQIGAHCAIYSENTENQTRGKIIIGDGALIGAFSLILPGAVIKPKAKIHSYSIVKSDDVKEVQYY